MSKKKKGKKKKKVKGAREEGVERVEEKEVQVGRGAPTGLSMERMQQKRYSLMI